MELTAAREAIRHTPIGAVLEIATDSRNVVGWLTGGFKRNHPAVAALCREIDAMRAEREVVQGGTVSFQHVRGHRGDVLNELADKLATGAIKRQ